MIYTSNDIRDTISPTRFLKPSRAELQSDDAALYREQLFFCHILSVKKEMTLRCMNSNTYG